MHSEVNFINISKKEHEISKIRLLKAISRRADNTIGKSKTKQKQTKTRQNKKNKKRQTMIHKTLHRKPKKIITCSRIDIAEIIWVGVKRQSLTHFLTHSLTHSIIKIDTMTLLVHNFTPKGVEDIHLQTSLYNTINKITFNWKDNSNENR